MGVTAGPHAIEQRIDQAEHAVACGEIRLGMGMHCWAKRAVAPRPASISAATAKPQASANSRLRTMPAAPWHHATRNRRAGRRPRKQAVVRPVALCGIEMLASRRMRPGGFAQRPLRRKFVEQQQRVRDA